MFDIFSSKKPKTVELFDLPPKTFNFDVKLLAKLNNKEIRDICIDQDKYIFNVIKNFETAKKQYVKMKEKVEELQEKNDIINGQVSRMTNEHQQLSMKFNNLRQVLEMCTMQKENMLKIQLQYLQQNQLNENKNIKCLDDVLNFYKGRVSLCQKIQIQNKNLKNRLIQMENQVQQPVQLISTVQKTQNLLGLDDLKNLQTQTSAKREKQIQKNETSTMTDTQQKQEVNIFEKSCEDYETQLESYRKYLQKLEGQVKNYQQKQQSVDRLHQIKNQLLDEIDGLKRQINQIQDKYNKSIQQHKVQIIKAKQQYEQITTLRKQQKQQFQYLKQTLLKTKQDEKLSLENLRIQQTNLLQNNIQKLTSQLQDLAKQKQQLIDKLNREAIKLQQVTNQKQKVEENLKIVREKTFEIEYELKYFKEKQQASQKQINEANNTQTVNAVEELQQKIKNLEHNLKETSIQNEKLKASYKQKRQLQQQLINKVKCCETSLNQSIEQYQKKLQQTINTYTSKIKQLEQQMNHQANKFKSQNKTQTQSIEKLIEINEINRVELKQRGQFYEKSLQQLKSSTSKIIEQQKIQINTLKTNNEKISIQYKQISQQSQKLKKQKQSLQKVNKQYEQQLSDFKIKMISIEQNDNIKQQNINGKINEFEKRIKHFQQQKLEQQNRIQQLQNKINSLTNINKRVIQQKSVLLQSNKEHFSNLSEDYNKKIQQCTKLDKQLKQKLRDIEQLKQQCSTKEIFIGNINKQVQLQKGEILNKSKQVQEQEKKINMLKGQINSLNAKIEEFEEQLQCKQRKYESQINQQRIKSQGFKRNLHNLQNKAEQSKTSFQKVYQESMNKNTKIVSMEKKLKEYKHLIQILRKQKSQLEQDYKNKLKGAIQQMSLHMEQDPQELKSPPPQQSNFTVDLTLKNQIITLQQQNSMLKQQIDELKQRYLEQQVQNEEHKKTIANLLEKRQKMMKELQKNNKKKEPQVVKPVRDEQRQRKIVDKAIRGFQIVLKQLISLYKQFITHFANEISTNEKVKNMDISINSTINKCTDMKDIFQDYL